MLIQMSRTHQMTLLLLVYLDIGAQFVGGGLVGPVILKCNIWEKQFTWSIMNSPFGSSVTIVSIVST